MRVGILTSHAVQYQAPWFRALAREVDLQVYFAHRQSAQEQARAGFGVAFDWDVDLLSGYQSHYLQNVAPNPDVNRYAGCDTPEIADIIQQDRFDAFIVVGWYLKSHWQAIRACRRAGVPVLVRGDSQLLTHRSRLKAWVKRITHSLMLRRLDGFLAAGQRNREYLRHYGVSDRRIFLVPQFVDNDWFAGKAAEVGAQRWVIRRNWRASDETLVVLFVGKFIPEKRPQDLIRAVAEWPGTRPTLIFVGSGSLEVELRQLASELSADVRFEGFRNQSELPLYYVSADALALPSGSETWGLVVNEAFACGIPAVVSDRVGCAPDLIEEGKTGFTFPAGDIGALQAKLQKMAELKAAGYVWQPALKTKIGGYSPQTAVTGTLAALRATIESRRR
ncbi:MAG TPA: glycosyltransferase [Chthoniobacterales bacterium]